MWAHSLMTLLKGLGDSSVCPRMLTRMNGPELLHTHLLGLRIVAPVHLILYIL